MSAKGCEVCGGLVKPVNDKSLFGYCEKCGLVYVLKERQAGSWDSDAPAGVMADMPRGREEKPRKEARAEQQEQLQQVSWECPDCGMVIEAESDSLKFAKRQHIADYHPNRTTE